VAPLSSGSSLLDSIRLFACSLDGGAGAGAVSWAEEDEPDPASFCSPGKKELGRMREERKGEERRGKVRRWNRTG
jgi:hypothetical protein